MLRAVEGYVGKIQMTGRNIIKSSYKRLIGHLSHFPFQKVPSKTEVSRAASGEVTVVAEISWACALCEIRYGALSMHYCVDASQQFWSKDVTLIPI